MAENIQLILWKPLFMTTIAMYLLVIILWIFQSHYATIVLIGILCLWSRIPCMMSMFTKDVDVIDFFVVFLAINLGGVFAGFFGMFMMFFSRIFGPGEPLDYTVKDSIAFLFGGLMTPLFYFLTGGNILLTMYLFTIFGRYGIYLLIDFIFIKGMFWTDMGFVVAGIPIAYFSNTILTSIFGDYLTTLFDSGLKLDLGLFLFVTVVIGVFYLFAYIIGKADKNSVDVIESYNKDVNQSYFLEPHKVILSYFESTRVNMVIEGSFKSFKLKIFIMTTIFILLRMFLSDYHPVWYEVIIGIALIYLTINLLFFLFFGMKKGLNKLFLYLKNRD